MGEKFWASFCGFVKWTTKGNIYSKGLCTKLGGKSLSELLRGVTDGETAPFGFGQRAPGFHPPDMGEQNPERTHFWSL